MIVRPRETVAFDAAAPRAGASFRPSTRQLAITAAVLAALVVPFVFKSFVVFQLTLVMVYGLAILGLNLLTGFNGQFSLGHSAFYGIGAYTAAILMDRLDLAYYWTLPCAGAVCFLVGFLFGLPALRLQGLYLALATFALATAMPQILKFQPLEPLTGGVQGIVIVKPDPPPGVPLAPEKFRIQLSQLRMRNVRSSFSLAALNAARFTTGPNTSPSRSITSPAPTPARTAGTRG